MVHRQQAGQNQYAPDSAQTERQQAVHCQHAENIRRQEQQPGVEQAGFQGKGDPHRRDKADTQTKRDTSRLPAVHVPLDQLRQDRADAVMKDGRRAVCQK